MQYNSNLFPTLGWLKNLAMDILNCLENKINKAKICETCIDKLLEIL